MHNGLDILYHSGGMAFLAKIQDGGRRHVEFHRK